MFQIVFSKDIRCAGLTTRGIYRLSGTHSKTSQLLSDFKQNARETQMLEGEVNVHDVANALKRWFKGLPGSLLTEQLHDDWLRTARKFFSCCFVQAFCCY